MLQVFYQYFHYVTAAWYQVFLFARNIQNCSLQVTHASLLETYEGIFATTWLRGLGIKLTTYDLNIQCRYSFLSKNNSQQFAVTFNISP